MKRKWIKWVSWILLTPVILFVILMVLLYIPPVQNFLRKEAADSSIVTATTEYGTQIHASVEKDNIFACQFHPEKSSRIGLKILQNFVDITKEYRDKHTQGGQ